tara:strand:+ start:191 stop:310 length:120 start_codon:yes stop_codon:yes gene_type:complete
MFTQNNQIQQRQEKKKVDAQDKFLRILWRKEVEFKLNTK